MSDFIIQIGKNIDEQNIIGSLQNRPGLRDRPVLKWKFKWGSIIIQAPPGRGYVPIMKNDTLCACSGRPRFIDYEHEIEGENGFCTEFIRRYELGKENCIFESLTGTFAIILCTNKHIVIMSDQMGAFPVYRAKDRKNNIVAIGTSVEILAKISNREQDWDLVSIGELLVFNNITFPYTTRHGIEEFSPASSTKIKLKKEKIAIDSRIIWEPKEPDSWLQDDEMIDRTEESMKLAAEEVTRGANTVAVSLSGGLDSRAVLSAIPRNHDLSAITYVTHENNETRVARTVAEAAGVKHLFAKRNKDYFADLLLDRGIILLGSERRAAAHGLCIPDSGLQSRFDLIIGGQLSDTFLKHHYMPYDQRESVRPKGLKERLKQLFGIRDDQKGPSIYSTIGRHLALPNLKKDIQEAVIYRRETRIKKLKEIRPVTGEEWSRFWPTSRQDDLAHILGNIRLFSFDTLFMQRYIIDVAVLLSEKQRYAGRIANKAFARLYGKLGNIENANTGVSASAGELIPMRKLKRHAKKISVDIPGAESWNNVQSSWADNIALQKYHPKWKKSRKILCESEALNIFNEITQKPYGNYIENYSDDLPPTFNQMLIQIGILMIKNGQMKNVNDK